MTDPRKLRSEAIRLRQQAAQLLQLAELREAEAAMRESFGSTSVADYATIGHMQSSPIDTAVKKRQGPAAHKGPAEKLRLELGYRSMAALAKALDEEAVTVRAWNERGIPVSKLPVIDALRASLKSRKKA